MARLSPDIGRAALVAQGHDLRSGEQIVETMTPRFLLFLQKTLVIGILTAIGFGLVPGLDISFAQQVGLALIIVMIWFFVFDEWQEWRDRRQDVWILTDRRLILVNPREEDSVSWLNLTDIEDIRRVLWWSLRIKASDGRVTPMSFVGQPITATRDKILLVRDAA